MKHPFPFDPTHGYTEQSLRDVTCPDEPGDFEMFWRETYHAAKQVATQPKRTLVRASRRMNLYDVEFDAWSLDGPIRLGGWMTTPANGKITAGLVAGHGYGGRTGPDLSPLISDAAVIYPCLRGFNRSARSDIPGVANQHVVHGIQSRETYVHRGCVVDVWAAAWALMELEPSTRDFLCYSAESFGGGIGSLALPWEPSFKRAFLDYPSFGHYPIRLTLACVGSGEVIRQAGGSAHLPVLRYFDAASAAKYNAVPTMVAAALFDPAVPTPGQFAIFNCLQGPKKLFVRQTAHFDWAGKEDEDRRVRLEAAKWLTPPGV